MGIVRVDLPKDGDTADVSDYNTPVGKIADEINGNLDDDNFDVSANIATSKFDFSTVALPTEKFALSYFDYRQATGSDYTTTSTSTVSTGITTDYTAGSTNERVLVTVDLLYKNSTSAATYIHLNQDGTYLNPIFYTYGSAWQRDTRRWWVDVDANTTTTLTLYWRVSGGTGSISRSHEHHAPRIKGIAFYRGA